jgi:cell division septation protein DedD
VTKLQGAGYGVRILSDREGQGALFRVRVGGYETRDEAALVATNLKNQGDRDAWVASP